jgi:hypothetical protein
MESFSATLSRVLVHPSAIARGCAIAQSIQAAPCGYVFRFRGIGALNRLGMITHKCHPSEESDLGPACNLEGKRSPLLFLILEEGVHFNGKSFRRIEPFQS